MPLPAGSSMPLHEPPTDEPLNRASVVMLASVLLLVALLVLAIAFDRLAAKGVLLVGFLSVALAYLIVPLVQQLRRTFSAVLGGWRPSHLLATAMLYVGITVLAAPVWSRWGQKIESQVPNVAGEIPRHVGRFVQQVRDSERWHERFRVEPRTRQVLRRATTGVSLRLQAEVRDVGAEVIRAPRLVPWLAAVPVIAFLLVTQWTAFHRSAARGLPTPHLRWRADQFMRHVNTVLAAYTRAQALSALFVGTICGIGFVLLRLPNAAMLGIVAGLLELVPIAGPLAVAISATAIAPPGDAVFVLAFLGALRILQDYAIYPRLIRRAMHLHPVAVVGSIWLGAMAGGIVGVCLAVPTVGVLQVAARHWREYREIERLTGAGR